MAEVVNPNKADMSRRCCQQVDINHPSGNKSSHAISVECDGMYNNPLYSRIRETPFETATQTVYSFPEDVI